MPKKNLTDLEKIHLPSWRKMAMASWRLTGDASTYAKLSLSVDKVTEYIDGINQKSQDVKVTLTHFIGKALAKTYQLNPEINRIFRFGKYYQRQDIDIFFLVASDQQGIDLTGKVIHNTHNKPLLDIAKELRGSVKSIRDGEKKPFGVLKKILNVLPIFIIKPLTKLLGFVLYTLNIQLPGLKLEKNPFGSAMVTSVGSLGLESAYAPLIPFSKVPMMMSIGAVQKRLRFNQVKEVVEEKFVELCFTVDHRIIDGVHGAKMAKSLSNFFDFPDTIDEIIA